MKLKRIGYAQFCPLLADREANLKEIERLAAAGARADLLVFPELAVTGYNLRDRAEARELSESFGAGPASRLLSFLAKKFSTTLVAGYAELDGERVYNACMIATPEGTLANYRKMHLYSRENDLFDPGDAPPPVVESPAGRIGLMICYDWFFPETARLLALGGAQVIAHPSNLILPFCQRAMYARSVENHVFTITANRIGTEERAGRSLTYTGASQVLDPKGETLAQAPRDREEIGLVEVDVSAADDKRLNGYNDLLAGRRRELYGALLRDEPRRTAVGL